jgi:hypothetical protein
MLEFDRQRDRGGRSIRAEERCNSGGRSSCQIVVDLFLFNLLTPRVTLHLSHRSPSHAEHPWPRTEVGSRVKNRCRKDRGGGLAEGETRTGSARAASNRKRRKGPGKTNCGSRGKRIMCAGDLYSPVVSDRFATERDKDGHEGKSRTRFSSL